ncbi:Dehydrogenase/reductase SDR family member 4 [Hondaea fermentalgiana]|uniref:Dehydrogenase/reductase SDR family member 4 n=1 Tax=Hondaea fermentalgiana TaxID=2315210 RepID=A0A2R5GVG1_9STRA|nr:Dehydrogenase/reductase SDR family member 4 [Hondaea fermentalgiana]|eukprot:GBG31904.1 Dehydrogenase/reductase SDR family member 4 [Hondaea fermentalgiana]
MQRVSKLTQHLSAQAAHEATSDRVERAETAAKVFQDKSRDAYKLDGSNLFSLRGKVALVTGGSKGIGKMIASGFVANGAKVYICSRKADLCDEVAAELCKEAEEYGNGGSAVSLPGDLSSVQGVERVAKRLAELESELHILVNNAGATWGAPFEEYPDSAWQKVMDLNVRHLFNLTQKCAPLLGKAAREGDPARVVNIASVDGIRATQTAGPTAAFAYTTSKGAVVHLTKALSRAMVPYYTTVNCVAPGVFPSQMTKFMLNSEAGSEASAANNPLKRVGRTADMAGTLLYLCSPAGAYTNGVTIAVDGGGHLFGDLGFKLDYEKKK